MSFFLIVALPTMYFLSEKLMKYYTVYCLRWQFNDAYQEFLCQLNEPFLEKGKVTLEKMLQIIHEIQSFDLDIFTEEIDVLKKVVV